MPATRVLETVKVDVAGAGIQEPLGRALQLAKHAHTQAAIIDALPREVALQAITELAEAGADYDVKVPWRSTLLEEIGENEREWAIARADAYPVGPHDPAAYLKLYIFRALVRAKVPIERRWEHLFPHVVGASMELLLECARGVAEDRRAAVLIEQSPDRGSGVHLVIALPSASLVTAFLKSTEVGTPRFVSNLGFMRQLGAKNEAVRDAVAAFEATLPKPRDLVVTSIVKPKTVDDLSVIAKEQLRIAGRGYDQCDLDAAARLEENGEETSFYGHLELRTIAEADGRPAYDMLIYMVDSGSIFDADTTHEIGGISQGGVSLTTTDEPLRAALQAASRVKKAKARKKPKAPKK